MKIEEIVVSFTPDTKKLDKSLKRVEKQLKGFGKIGKANNKIFGDFLRLAGFAGLTKMTMDAAHFAHSMQVLGQQTGIATDKLSKMSSVWKVWGADAKSLATFSKRLASDIAGRYAGKDSPFYGAFRRFNVDPLDASRNIKDLRTLFGELARQASQRTEPKYITQNLLEDYFGMPPEVAQKLLEGESAWYKFYDEAASRVGDITTDEMKTLDKGLQQLNEALENYSIAIKKSAAGILGFLQQKGIISGVSNFVKENPTASIIGTALAARYAIPVAKGAWKAPSLMAKAMTNPFFAVPFGIYATAMEISGRNILGKKRNTENDLASQVWANIKDIPPSLKRFGEENYRIGNYKRIAKELESNKSGLDYERVVNAIGGDMQLLQFLREYRADEPKMNEWDRFFEWYDDTTRAERIGNSSYEFNQENNIRIDGNASRETVDYMVDRLGTIPMKNKPIYNAMSGVAN